MHEQMRQPVEDVWHHHLAALEESLDESIRSLQNLLRTDEYHRSGHEEPQLARTVGPFGSGSLDLSSLSEVLGKSASSRAMSGERLNRVNRLLVDLQALREECADNPDTFPEADIGEDEKAIHARAEEHLNHMAGIFGKLRMAQLEIRSKYHPGHHDAVYGQFGWRDLSPNEMRLCPPFIVTAQIGQESGEVLRKILSLLESRKPMKVVALRSSLRKKYSPTANPICPATLSVEMVPLAMRGVYFLQSSVAAGDFPQRLFEALASPRPTLISLLAQKDDENHEAFEARAGRAMRCQAFPAVLYDPDKAPGFVSCFDLSANLEPDPSFTFAHYAAAEPEFAGDFQDPAGDMDPRDFVEVSEYLELTRRQRIGKHPVLNVHADESNETVTTVCSQAIVTQMSDLKHLWRTLQEIAGVDNPYVKDTRESLTEEFGAQQKALLESQQEDMEKEAAHREQVAVANAVRRIVSHFTGVDAGEITLETLLQQDNDR